MHHSFDINLAAEYGIEEAILIHHFQHWIRVNQSLKRNFIEGRTWSYQTLDEIAAHFPYLNKSKVSDLLEKLCEGKGRKSKKEELDFAPVLIKGNFNKNPYDRTIWYAFIEEPKCILGNPNIDEGKSQNEKREIPKSIISDAKPDSKTNTKEPPPTSSKDSPPSSGGGGGLPLSSSLVGDWTYRNVKGEACSKTQTQIFKHFLGLSFSTEIVKEAIKQASESNELIGDPWRYLEAICFRLTQEDKPKIEKKEKNPLPPKNTEPRLSWSDLQKREAQKTQETKNE